MRISVNEGSESETDLQLTRGVTDDDVTIPVTDHATVTNPVSVDDFTSAHAPVMSAVEPHAIDAASRRIDAEQCNMQDAEDSATPTSAGAEGKPGPLRKGVTDDLGRTYDPRYHEFPLRFNRSGYLAKLRGGAAAAGRTISEKRSFASVPDAASAREQVVAPAAQIDPAIYSAKCEALAKMGTGMFYAIGGMVFGDDMAPSSDKDGEAEVAQCEATLKNYFIVSGCPDIPPGVAVVACFGMVLFKRYNTKPTVAQKMTSWARAAYVWCMEKFK